MPYICNNCKSESEFDTCEWCGQECDWSSEIWEARVCYICEPCGAKVIKILDLGHPLSWFSGQDVPGDYETYCPACEQLSPHSYEIVSCKKKINPEVFLDRAYSEELEKARKKPRKRKEQDA
jgi:hypothetical protein